MAKDIAITATLLGLVVLAAVFIIVSPSGPPSDPVQVAPGSGVMREAVKKPPTKPHSSIKTGPFKSEYEWEVEKQTYKKLPSSVYAKRDIARMDFNFKKVSNKFCGGDNYTRYQKCSKEYKESLVMTALPLMIVGLITLLVFLLVLIGRNCLVCFGNGCCGGRVPSHGFCFGDKLERDSGYTSFRRKIYVFLVFCILVLTGVAMAVGFTGNTQLSNGVMTLMSTTQNLPTKVARQVTYISAETTTIKSISEAVNPGVDTGLWKQTLDALKDIQKSLKDLKKQASDAYIKVKKYEKMRKDFFEWAFIAAPIIATLGVVGYFLPSVITLLVIPIIIILVFLMWVVVGVHVPVAVATADFCVDLDYALKHPNASMGAVDMLLKCGGKTGGKKMLDNGNKFIDKGYATACEALTGTNGACHMPNFTYPGAHGHTNTLVPVKCPTTACNKNTLNDFINKTVVADFQWGCAKLVNGTITTVDCTHTDKTQAKKQCLAKYGNDDVLPCLPSGGAPFRSVNLQTCSKSCLLNSTRTFSNKIYGNYDILWRFSRLKKERLEPLLGCEIIRKGVANLEHTLCWDVVNATDYIIAGLCIIGITFFFGVAVYLGAQKVFNRKFWEEYYPKYYDELNGAEQGSAPLLGAGTKAEEGPQGQQPL